MNGIRSYVPPTLRTLTLLLMVIMVGVVMMSAQTKTASAKKKTTTTAAKQPAASAGQKVYIDPVTKEIVQPTQAQIDELENAGKKKVAKKSLAAQAPVAEPQEYVSDAGVITMALPEESLTYAVVTKTADGKLVTSCIEGKSKAEAAAKAKAKPAPAKSEVLDVK